MQKFLAVLLSGAILSSNIVLADPVLSSGNESTAVTSEAAVPISAKVDTSPTDQELEKAILAVKKKITIPKEYSEFDYYYSYGNSYQNSSWNLTWRNPENGSYIRVACDLNNHIVSYNSNDYTAKVTGIPNYLKKELKSKADNFIKKIAPEVYNHLAFVDSSYQGIYSGNYIYTYHRTENGIPFPDNTVTVRVNSLTGEVNYANINWLYDTLVPSGKTQLSKEEASKILKENMTMNLVYRSDYSRIYSGDSDTIRAYLVYEPSKNYISVDAKTGQVYNSKYQWVSMDDSNKEAVDEDTSDKSMDSGKLTEEEIKKIEELKYIISKDKAIKAITENKALYIDKNINTITANLMKYTNSKNDSNYVWQIRMNDTRPIDYEKGFDYYRAYAYANVDAKTGKILSFYSSLNSNYDDINQKWNEVEINYDKEQAREILEKFLKAQIKDRFENSKLVEDRHDYVAYYIDKTPVYGGYRYDYQRVNEGVIYPYNGIYGAVDGVTGKIYNYSSNWNDNIKFESPKNAMTPEEALDHYLSKDGYELRYEINEVTTYHPDPVREERYYDPSDVYTTEHEIRLVYTPDISPYFISPFTGEQLNYDGSVYSKTKPYEYKDITDIEKNRPILLLSDMNIGFEGEYFYPTKEITIAEVNMLLEKLGYGYSTEQNLGDVNSKINKEKIAQLFINRLGFEKISKLQGIYQTGYKDQHLIDTDYLGAVALAKGLGLITADERNNFNPKNNITREEAIHLILNFIEAQQTNRYYY